MKICVNARPLIKPHTGMGQHAKYILKEVAKIRKGDEFIVIVPEKLSEEIENIFPKNVKIKILPEKKFGIKGLNKTWWEQVRVLEYILKEKADLAYFMYPANPWARDFYRKCRVILTVHDAIPWKYKSYRKNFLSKLYHFQSRKACAKADIVITVSKTSKKDIIKFCGVAGDKVKVVYNDAGDEYKKKTDMGFLKISLKKYDLKENDYFIYCGGYDLRKNVRKLLKEYFMFAKKFGKRSVPLVLAGDKVFDTDLYKSFDDFSEEEKGGRIVKTGFIDDAELAALYSGARAFVNVSADEGFNIPLLEAANCGCALLLSDIEVHREVAGSGADYVDLGEEGAICDKLLEAVDDEKNAKAKERAGKIAGNFLWERSGARVSSIIDELFLNKKHGSA